VKLLSCSFKAWIALRIVQPLNTTGAGVEITIPFQPWVSLPLKVAPVALSWPRIVKPVSGAKFTTTPLSTVRLCPGWMDILEVK
jgi:hypothetical protein